LRLWLLLFWNIDIGIALLLLEGGVGRFDVPHQVLGGTCCAGPGNLIGCSSLPDHYLLAAARASACIDLEVVIWGGEGGSVVMLYWSSKKTQN